MPARASRRCWAARWWGRSCSPFDFLHQPAVAIRIAERQKRFAAPPLRVQPGPLLPLGEMERLARLDSAAGELIAGRVDVGDDQVQSAQPAGASVALPRYGAPL